MAQVINTNISSLNAQRNLNTSQAGLATSLQRLSTGLRINSSKDDAAGLAISERMTAQIRGLNQASRNANDAISLAQTAEGAFEQITTNLQRVRELAVQSRNATNSPEDRKALNTEAQQLVQDINRIAQSTSFNGTKLLDGGFGNKEFQIGSGTESTDRISVSSSTMINATAASLGTYNSASVTSVAATDFTAIAANTISIQNASGTAVNLGAIGGANATERAASFAAAVNAVADQTGVFATLDTNTTVTLKSSHAITVAGTGTTEDVGLSNATTAITSKTGFAALDISTTAGADDAMNAMDAALTAVNTARASLGAVQSRFESAIGNLQTTAENLTASRSRIRDADFAAETGNLTRSQILQQAGTAMLAQANALPQQVLTLLRG